METKDELLSEGEKYFEKVIKDFNQNRKGRNLRKTAQRMLPCYYKAPFWKKLSRKCLKNSGYVIMVVYKSPVGIDYAY